MSDKGNPTSVPGNPTSVSENPTFAPGAPNQSNIRTSEKTVHRNSTGKVTRDATNNYTNQCETKLFDERTENPTSVTENPTRTPGNPSSAPNQSNIRTSENAKTKNTPGNLTSDATNIYPNQCRTKLLDERSKNPTSVSENPTSVPGNLTSINENPTSAPGNPTSIPQNPTCTPGNPTSAPNQSNIRTSEKTVHKNTPGNLTSDATNIYPNQCKTKLLDERSENPTNVYENSTSVPGNPTSVSENPTCIPGAPNQSNIRTNEKTVHKNSPGNLMSDATNIYPNQCKTKLFDERTEIPMRDSKVARSLKLSITNFSGQFYMFEKVPPYI